jgi:hypothetical protein
VHRSCACAAVSEFGKTRFLPNEAPQIPVSGCDAATCECRYARHWDRRASGDRRSFIGLQTELYAADGNAERRAVRGRRKEDLSGTANTDFGLEGIEWVS